MGYDKKIFLLSFPFIDGLLRKIFNEFELDIMKYIRYKFIKYGNKIESSSL